jgi:uncharacterized membrane protein required for colicin V production
MTLSVIDILFLLTVALLVFNGLRNGAVFSLLNLIGIPLGFAITFFYGPRFTQLLASNGLPATPLIAYIVLFFGTSLILHIIGTSIRGFLRQVPGIGCGDSLLGAFIGFVEAWLLWLFLLIVLGSFLVTVQGAIQPGATTIPGFSVQVQQFQQWHDFYNQAVTNSLFAKVNSFFVKELPQVPHLPQAMVKLAFL